MERMRSCLCLVVIIMLLFLRSEARPLNPNMKDKKNHQSLFRLEARPLNPNMKDRKNRSLSSSSLLAMIKDRYVPKREIPGGPRFLGEVVPLNRGPVAPSAPNPITHGANP
ncbi:uncharacterized protein LOC126720043 isoform X2 [Quercus robur]|uniref:uncharacterized protein LOC126720043 isoform X2 n=1 Tax=Quercus robur TaxID=38942 RepID=UPI00216313DF|nr:uncharacterized protein LOC126720043 isoform X2 [Quercus robur]